MVQNRVNGGSRPTLRGRVGRSGGRNLSSEHGCVDGLGRAGRSKDGLLNGEVELRHRLVTHLFRATTGPTPKRNILITLA